MGLLGVEFGESMEIGGDLGQSRGGMGGPEGVNAVGGAVKELALGIVCNGRWSRLVAEVRETEDICCLGKR